MPKLTCSVPFDDEGIVNVCKDLVGRDDERPQSTKWIKKMARLTEIVQDELEAPLEKFKKKGTTDLELTSHGFLDWADKANALCNKRAVDGTRVQASRTNKLTDLLYMAIAASILSCGAVDWLDGDSTSLDEKQDALRERGSEKAEAKADHFDEIKCKIDDIRNDLECRYGDGPSPMRDAIAVGDVDGILETLGYGVFFLDI